MCSIVHGQLYWYPTSTTIKCIYINSLALRGPDAFGASKLHVLILAYPGCHGLFQDAFNVMNRIHSAFPAQDTAASVLREVQHTGRVNAVHSQSDAVYRGIRVQEPESNYSFPSHTFNQFLIHTLSYWLSASITYFLSTFQEISYSG